MKAAIKGLHSPDVEDVQSYIPADKQKFGFLLQLFIGPEGGHGYESFDVMVCTPEWLRESHTNEAVIIGKHLLIVFEYDFMRIMQRINSYVDDCSGETWAEVASKLSHLGKWEFEDYKP